MAESVTDFDSWLRGESQRAVTCKGSQLNDSNSDCRGL